MPLSMLAARRKASWVWLSTGVIYPPMKSPFISYGFVDRREAGNEQNLPKAIEGIISFGSKVGLVVSTCT